MRLVLFSVLFLTGCASMLAPVHSRTQVSLQHDRKYEPVGTQDFAFENKDLSVKYIPDIVDAGNSFIFENRTDKPINIIWDESSFLSPGGTSSKIFHSGVKIADRSASNPPTTIPPRSKITDDILPVDNVYYVASSGWSYAPLCGERDSLPPYSLNDDPCIGKELGYFITYEIDGKKKNFTIKYKFVGKEPIKKDGKKLASETPSSR